MIFAERQHGHRSSLCQVQEKLLFGLAGRVIVAIGVRNTGKRATSGILERELVEVGEEESRDNVVLKLGETHSEARVTTSAVRGPKREQHDLSPRNRPPPPSSRIENH